MAANLTVMEKGFLEGNLVTSGSGTSSWSSTGAGILNNSTGTSYMHLTGSGNQTLGSFSASNIGFGIYKSGGTVTANGYISCYDAYFGFGTSGSTHANSSTFLVDNETFYTQPNFR